MAEIRLNPAGVRALLHDPGVIKDLQDRMASAEAAYGRDVSIDTEIYASGRAIVTMTDNDPKSLYKEAHTGDMARSLRAAGAKENKPGTKWGPFSQ